MVDHAQKLAAIESACKIRAAFRPGIQTELGNVLDVLISIAQESLRTHHPDGLTDAQAAGCYRWLRDSGRIVLEPAPNKKDLPQLRSAPYTDLDILHAAGVPCRLFKNE